MVLAEPTAPVDPSAARARVRSYALDADADADADVPDPSAVGDVLAAVRQIEGLELVRLQAETSRP
jgi:hypothetical protein